MRCCKYRLHIAHEREEARGVKERTGDQKRRSRWKGWGRQVGVGPQDPRQGGAADRGRAEPPAVRRRSPLSGGSSERRGRWPGRSGPLPVEETARLQLIPAREETARLQLIPTREEPRGRGAWPPREPGAWPRVEGADPDPPGRNPPAAETGRGGGLRGSARRSRRREASGRGHPGRFFTNCCCLTMTAADQIDLPRHLEERQIEGSAEKW